MAGLLSADAVSVPDHILVDVFVADSSLLVSDACLVKGLIESEVGHDRSHNRVVEELAPLLHVATVNIEDVVARDHIALLIHTKASVRVAVIGKAGVQILFQYKLLQMLNMGGAAVRVDIEAVGLVIDHIGLGAERVKYGLGDGPCRAVGCVQTDPLAVKAIF